MQHFHHTSLVKVPCKQLYAVIVDIEAYPRIIQQCQEAKVNSRTPIAGGGEEVVASLSLKLGPLKREFVTRNIHTPYSSIKVDLHSGSVQSLFGEWRLHEIDDGLSKVECSFNFSLGNSAIDTIAAKFLQSYLKTSVENYISFAETSTGN